MGPGEIGSGVAVGQPLAQPRHRLQRSEHHKTPEKDVAVARELRQEDQCRVNQGERHEGEHGGAGVLDRQHVDDVHAESMRIDAVSA